MAPAVGGDVASGMAVSEAPVDLHAKLKHLRPLARVMQPGGIFRVASDIPDYIRQTREEVPPAGFETVDDTAQA